MEMELSDGVLALLMAEMQRLPDELQLGLKSASCIGSHVKCIVIEVLSKDLDVDLKVVLNQISQKGFMNNVDGAMFSFVHDKIEQAARELMSEQERREYHMKFGLAICAHTMDSATETDQNDELFFLSMNQINRGGSEVLSDPRQRAMIAALNLKAGRRAIDFSDYNTAFALFEHGISFLEGHHWTMQYELSIDLFDAAAESACVLNNGKAVTSYAEKVLAHAKCFDDKVNCEWII